VARISSFSPEFREEAVRLVRESGRPVAHVAKELDVNPETLGRWVRLDKRECGSGESADLTVSERARLRELERVNREQAMKIEFLEKAAAYFAANRR
jgi:transposase